MRYSEKVNILLFLKYFVSYTRRVTKRRNAMNLFACCCCCCLFFYFTVCFIEFSVFFFFIYLSLSFEWRCFKCIKKWHNSKRQLTTNSIKMLENERTTQPKLNTKAGACLRVMRMQINPKTNKSFQNFRFWKKLSRFFWSLVDFFSISVLVFLELDPKETKKKQQRRKGKNVYSKRQKNVQRTLLSFEQPKKKAQITVNVRYARRSNVIFRLEIPFYLFPNWSFYIIREKSTLQSWQGYNGTWITWPLSVEHEHKQWTMKIGNFRNMNILSINE